MEKWKVKFHSKDSSYEFAPDKIEEYSIPAPGIESATSLVQDMLRNFSYTGHIHKITIEKDES